MIADVIRSFRPDRQPLMTRQSYSHELRSASTFSWVIALLEGSVIGILARRFFDVTPLMFAILMASQTFAFLTSLLWAHVAGGRRKVPFIVALMLARSHRGARCPRARDGTARPGPAQSDRWPGIDLGPGGRGARREQRPCHRPGP